MPQVTAETPDYRSSFKLAGGVAALAVPPIAAVLQQAPPSPAQQFHDRLRQLERSRAWGAPAGAPPGAAAPHRAVPPALASIVPGDRREFRVLTSLSTFPIQTAKVVAFAQSVGQHIALYVDSAAPQNGLTAQDFDALRAVFDTLLYRTDTAAFGRESDIDGNGLVIVLMTNRINQLVSAADCLTTGYIAGYFLGSDIDPLYAAEWNNGEIVYSMVADSGATLSCSHPNSQVQRVVPVTFIHEFQHMISYSQHVVTRGGAPEVLWLNEAMSHYAEELGGRAFLAGTGGTDSVHFCNHVRGDLANLALYWKDPGSHALVDTSGIGGLPERGAGWLSVRYLVDRFAADTTIAAANALTRQIDETALIGTANVTSATGHAFATTVEEWALASWVSDLPGFTAPAALTYKHWAFRTAYPRMNATCSPNLPASFPLTAVASAGPTVNLTGAMWAGSGAGYQRALQGPGGAGFTLLFSDAKGLQLSPTVEPRLNVLRIR
ncbi:MAG: hypothetical protein AUH42_00040 [Gemmatimonadetes bacterium 13_1_40CM_70_11]|nr:MAG: hypothetical protein AUH42_00040 [Gemmatimonadetes bacterium 13_1_40CM_70_11]